MDFQPLQSVLLDVDTLLSSVFTIPPFQRLYAWEDVHRTALVEDLIASSADGKPLFLGLCVIARQNDVYQVIDGQQRLTTLALLLHALGDPRVTETLPDGTQRVFVRPQEPDYMWLKKLLANEYVGTPQRYSQKLLSDGLQYFHNRRNDIALNDVLNCQMIVYCAKDIQGATSLFERINVRGSEISSIELVKNKLFDWAARLSDGETRRELEAELVERFAEIFSRLNPFVNEGPIDNDSFLRSHWILFDENHTKTTDFSDMNLQIDKYMKAGLAILSNDASLSRLVRDYVKSLSECCIVWRKVTAPRHNTFDDPRIGAALQSFHRMNRDANFTPLLVSALRIWGETDETLSFIQFIEMACFRQTLVGEQSNTGRLAKWKIAKGIFQSGWSYNKAMNRLFWSICPWWNRAEAMHMSPGSEVDVLDRHLAESAFADTKAYNNHRRSMKYFFWEYGRWLPNRREWPETREDVSVLTDDQWERTFQTLEVEHIYPQNPLNGDSREVKERSVAMSNYLHHWGNLTLLTKRDNASLQNSVFRQKLAKVLEYNANLLFNKLLSNVEYRGNLSNDAWSPNNCKKRSAALAHFANLRWGEEAMKRFRRSIGPYEESFDDPPTEA